MLGFDFGCEMVVVGGYVVDGVDIVVGVDVDVVFVVDL